MPEKTVLLKILQCSHADTQRTALLDRDPVGFGGGKTGRIKQFHDPSIAFQQGPGPLVVAGGDEVGGEFE